MATLQCSKPAGNETTYQQKCHGSQSSSQTHAQGQAETQVTVKAQAQCVAGETHVAPSHTKGHHHGMHHQEQTTNGMACQGKAKKKGTEHKKERKNLLQRIKDSISGDSSSSDSSSESDNDNDPYAKRKN